MKSYIFSICTLSLLLQFLSCVAARKHPGIFETTSHLQQHIVSTEDFRKYTDSGLSVHVNYESSGDNIMATTQQTCAPAGVSLMFSHNPSDNSQAHQNEWSALRRSYASGQVAGQQAKLHIRYLSFSDGKAFAPEIVDEFIKQTSKLNLEMIWFDISTELPDVNLVNEFYRKACSSRDSGGAGFKCGILTNAAGWRLSGIGSGTSIKFDLKNMPMIIRHRFEQDTDFNFLTSPEHKQTESVQLLAAELGFMPNVVGYSAALSADISEASPDCGKANKADIYLITPGFVDDQNIVVAATPQSPIPASTINADAVTNSRRKPYEYGKPCVLRNEDVTYLCEMNRTFKSAAEGVKYMDKCFNNILLVCVDPYAHYSVVCAAGCDQAFNHCNTPRPLNLPAELWDLDITCFR